MPEKRPHLTASFLEEGKKLDTGHVPTGFWMVLGVTNRPIVDGSGRYPPIWSSEILSTLVLEFGKWISRERKWSGLWALAVF